MAPVFGILVFGFVVGGGVFGGVVGGWFGCLVLLIKDMALFLNKGWCCLRLCRGFIAYVL